MKLTCGHEGEYGVAIEIRNGKFVCADVAACDMRDAARLEAAS